MPMDTTVVESPIEVQALADILSYLDGHQPTMYLCLEGPNFSSAPVLLSILVIDPAAVRHVYLLHIHALGSNTFDIRGDRGLTLRDILQRNDIPKVFFDLRRTAASLYSLYGISLRGVLDLQLMGDITRRPIHLTYPRHAGDLISCIRGDSQQPSDSIDAWERTRSLSDPHVALTQSSLSARAQEYAVGGVVGLPALTWAYLDRFRAPWKDPFMRALVAETRKRVRVAQGRQPGGGDEEEVDYPLLHGYDLKERVRRLLIGR